MFLPVLGLLEGEVAFPGPFRRAAENAAGLLVGGNLLPGEKQIENLAGIVLAGGAGITAAVVEAALVAKGAFLIEDEDVGRCDRAIGLRDRLRLAVVEVGEVEFVVLGVCLHFFEGISVDRPAELPELPRRAGRCRRSRRSDTLGAVGGDELLETILGGDRVRAVIAGEDHCEELVIGKVVELPIFSRRSPAGRTSVPGHRS